MKFYSIRELRTETKDICDTVKNGCDAVVTNNGKPVMLLVEINEDNFEQTIQALRQARIMMAYNEMREIASQNGFMTEAEIEAEINAARKERKDVVTA